MPSRQPIQFQSCRPSFHVLVMISSAALCWDRVIRLPFTLFGIIVLQELLSQPQCSRECQIIIQGDNKEKSVTKYVLIIFAMHSNIRLNFIHTSIHSLYLIRGYTIQNITIRLLYLV